MIVYVLLILAINVKETKFTNNAYVFETKAHCEKNIDYIKKQLTELGFDKQFVTCEKTEIQQDTSNSVKLK